MFQNLNSQWDSYKAPADFADYLNNRSKFEHQIKSWCKHNDIGFFSTYDKIELLNFDKFVKLCVFELIADQATLTALDRTLKSNGQHLFYLTDNLLDPKKTEPFKHITFVSITELLGIVSLHTVSPNPSPSRLYNCFIQRVDSVRQSWFYFLQHHELLPKGYVTFLLFQHRFYSDKTGIQLYDWIHQNYELYNLPHFDQAYHQLRPHVPYRNVPETTDLYKYASDCKYSLVLETYAVEDDSVGFCITEKTHRALQTPTINLIFAQQRSLFHLSQLGFQISDQMLKIDRLPWIERQQRILEILIDDCFDFDAKMLYNQAIHNRELIRGYKQQFLKGDFLDGIFSDIIAI